MKHALNCKFCQKPITVEIDDTYAELGDQLKLLPLACCNNCADIRNLRSKLERKIQAVCTLVHMAGNHATTELINKSRNTLIGLTKDYARMISQWHHMDGMAWDEECVNLLIDKPDKWNLIIGELWKLFRDSQRQRT